MRNKSICIVEMKGKSNKINSAIVRSKNRFSDTAYWKTHANSPGVLLELGISRGETQRRRTENNFLGKFVRLFGRT